MVRLSSLGLLESSQIPIVAWRIAQQAMPERCLDCARAPRCSVAIEEVTCPRLLQSSNAQMHSQGRRREYYLPRRLKRVRPRHLPGVAEARIAGAVDQFTRTKRRIEFCERQHLGGRAALGKMDRPQFLRMFEARGGEQLGQRMQGGVMIVVDAID